MPEFPPSFYLPIFALLGVPFVIGLAAILMGGKPQGHSFAPPALLFHSIPQGPVKGVSHTPKRLFESIVPSLAANKFHGITVRESMGRGSKSPSQNNVAITFDDGFMDMYTEAYPILQKWGYKATVFPVLSSVGTYATWDIYSPQMCMGKEQLRELARNGFEIGSHTVSHPDLTLLDTARVTAELEDSKKGLEDIVGEKVLSISFPFGQWNERVWDIATQCGYKFAAIYQYHHKAHYPLLPVLGVYAFDTVDDVMDKIRKTGRFNISSSRSRILPHFAKGTALWKFRKEYILPSPRT